MSETTENDVERNLQSIFYIYQQDRRRFMLQKKQAESWIKEVLNLSDDGIVELSGNQLKITTYKDYPIYVQDRICKYFEKYEYFEKYVKNFSVVTDYVSESVQITMELKRIEDDEGEYDELENFL